MPPRYPYPWTGGTRSFCPPRYPGDWGDSSFSLLVPCGLVGLSHVSPPGTLRTESSKVASHRLNPEDWHWYSDDLWSTPINRTVNKKPLVFREARRLCSGRQDGLQQGYTPSTYTMDVHQTAHTRNKRYRRALHQAFLSGCVTGWNVSRVSRSLIKSTLQIYQVCLLCSGGSPQATPTSSRRQSRGQSLKKIAYSSYIYSHLNSAICLICISLAVGIRKSHL